MRFFLVIITILLAVSCGERRDITQLPPAEILVRCDTINEPEDYSDYTGMTVKDSLLIMFNQLTENCIRIFNLNNNSLICEFGEYGNQPAEFKSAEFTECQMRNDSILEIHDFGQKRLKTMNLTNILNGGNIWNNIKGGILPDELFNVHSMKRLDENSVIARPMNGYEGGAGQIIYDFKTGKSRIIEFYPPLKGRFNKSNIYRGYTATNINKGVIVEALLYIDAVNFYDSTGEIFKSYSFRDGVKMPEIGRDKNPINRRPYSGRIYGTENYCYVNKVDEIRENVAETKIIVFDWEGNIKKVFQLDNIWFHEFCVDEKTKRIIGTKVDYETGYVKIITYQYDEI